MTTPVTLATRVQQAGSETNPLLTFLFLATTIMSGVGLHAMLPNDDWVHYTITFILAGAVFACLKLIWTYQIKLFVPLATHKPSSAAIIAHIGAIILTACLSMPTTYTGLAWVSSSEHDMGVSYGESIDHVDDLKRNFHATTSIKSYVDTQADRMSELAFDASEGTHSGTAGKGRVYYTYLQASDALKRLSAQIDQNREVFESGLSRIDIAQGKMRHALEADLSIPEKEALFEQAYRTHAGIYAEMMEVDLARLIETSLNSFMDEAIAPKTSNDKVRQALQLAQRATRGVAGDITKYVNAKVVVLKPIEPYQLASPAVVSFRYIKQRWVEFALSCALDLSILVAVWMQIAALRKAQEASGLQPNFPQA